MIEKVIVSWKDDKHKMFKNPQDRFIFRGLSSNGDHPTLVRIFASMFSAEELKRIIRDTAHIVGTNGKVLINGEPADEFIKNHEHELH